MNGSRRRSARSRSTSRPPWRARKACDWRSRPRSGLRRATRAARRRSWRGFRRNGPSCASATRKSTPTWRRSIDGSADLETAGCVGRGSRARGRDVVVAGAARRGRSGDRDPEAAGRPTRRRERPGAHGPPREGRPLRLGFEARPRGAHPGLRAGAASFPRAPGRVERGRDGVATGPRRRRPIRVGRARPRPGEALLPGQTPLCGRRSGCGAGAGSRVAAVAEIRDRSVKGPEDLETILPQPLLAIIPEVRVRGR